MRDLEDKELGQATFLWRVRHWCQCGMGVGIKGDTAQFAVASIRRLLDVLGREHYPDARELTITVDGGGLNLLRLVDSCRRP